MNISEAYKILEVDENISDEDLKKKYKSLARKYHPDFYKDDPEKFKKINEAHQTILDFKLNPHKHQQGFSGGNPFEGFNININDIFNNIGGFGGQSRKQHRHLPEIIIPVSLTFKESVCGSEKEIDYKRFKKCGVCGGEGEKKIKNDCKSCNGLGKSTTTNRGSVFIQNCNVCKGQGIKTEKCIKCSDGLIEESIHNKIHIPVGAVNNAILKLRGAGHYTGDSMFGESYSDISIKVSVEKDDDLYIKDNDVICPISISLLEALEGKKLNVKTVYGEREINIPVLAKNKEEIIIPGCGLKNTNGTQRVILNVNYPENIENLLNLLKQTTEEN
jgi:molecular chaperone DnaJ